MTYRWPDGALAFCVAAGLIAASASQVKAQSATVEGWLNVVWDVEPSASNPDGVALFVVGEDGKSTRIRAQGSLTRELLKLDRQRVRVGVESVRGDSLSPSRTATANRVTALSAAISPGVAPAQVAQRPFVTLLCRFQGDESTPTSVAEMAPVLGPAYPGAGHYFGELAQDAAVMSGNRTVGWYTLPKPRAGYIRGDTTDFGALVTDCTGAADADVNFPSWYGINMQFNGDLSRRTTTPFDPLSFGGSWTLTRDGVTRVYGMTWIGGTFTKNYVVYHHEMGHALGWPHSSGQYGQEYDSRWDLMSVGYLNSTPQYGWLPIHTIASHKDRAGWIPAARKWIPSGQSAETREIARTALPPDGSTMLMAEIPISAQSVYTLEARRVAGYDTPLPGEAVVIHRVDNGRAYVVDPDANGNPNDESAMWVPGETFSDPSVHLSVAIESATSTGFMVRITRGLTAVIIAGPVQRKPAAVNSAYADTLRASGGGGTYTWAVSGGTLPPGLALAESGILAGTPLSPGTFQFRVQVASSSGGVVMTATQTIIVVVIAALDQARVMGQLFGNPSLSSAELAFLDQIGNRNGRFDLGDVRAWLIDTGRLSAGPPAAGDDTGRRR